jgi:hypothetical protein
MGVSLLKSKLRRVQYLGHDSATHVGWFHAFVLRKGDYTGYSTGALVETDSGKVVIIRIGDFKFVDDLIKKHRRLIFINEKGATELGFFHLWVRRKGKYIGVDTLALIEKKNGELIVYPYNEITFIDTDT